VTAAVYYKLGLFAEGSISVFSVLAPSVVVGIPLGAYLIRGLNAEAFRRICMSFDAWIVGFGVSRTLIELNLLASPGLTPSWPLRFRSICICSTFFSRRKGTPPQQPPKPVSSFASDGSEFQDSRFTDDMRKLHRTASSPLEMLFGYAIGGISTLIYAAAGKF
jgi:hypothetical protein